MVSTNVHSTTGAGPGTAISPIVSLSFCDEKHLQSIVPYDSSRPVRPVVRAADAPTSQIDDMIKELAARLDARIATEGSILKAEAELKAPLVVTIYKKLPLELQDQVWMFAAMDRPRRVEIEYNVITDKFGRVKLQERNPPISLRQVNQHVRNMRPELLGYKSISVMSVVHGMPCTYLIHPQVDMLGISRMYQVDSVANNHVKEIMVTLKSENMLDKIRYIAVNQHYLCQMPSCLLPLTRNEMSRLPLSRDEMTRPYYEDNHLFRAGPRPNAAVIRLLGSRASVRQNLYTNLPTVTLSYAPPAPLLVLSDFPDLELVLSISTRCDHLPLSSFDLNNSATEFEGCESRGNAFFACLSHRLLQSQRLCSIAGSS